MNSRIKFANLSAAWLYFGTLGFSQQVAFQPPLTSRTLAGPVAMGTGDFNGDGMADLAISDVGSHVIAVLLGNGDGTFQAAATYPAASGCVVGSLIVADFNNDHKLDLLAICEGGMQIFVYPGNGDGTFAAAVVTALPAPAFAGSRLLEVGAAGVGAAAADFNNDGKLDLVLSLTRDSSVFGSPETNAYFMPGKGDGSFGAAVQIQREFGVVAIAPGDFDGDHKTDLALVTLTQGEDSDGKTTFSQGLSIQLGNGDGTFHAGATYSWAGATYGLIAADLNGDGSLDLLAAGTSLPTISTAQFISPVTVMLGDGKGNFHPGFSAKDLLNDLGSGFCLANLRGNGPVDLLETITHVDLTARSVSILTGVRISDGKGGFQDLQTFAGADDFYVLGAVCADLNGDGLTDVAYIGISVEAVGGVLSGSNLHTLLDLARALTALPDGNLYVSLNATPQTLSFSNVNGASFAKGPVAANSIVTAFWNSPVKPKDVGVNVQDALGATRPAQIFFVSSKQINYAMPDGTVLGNATITITGTQDTFTSQQQIVAVAPGVFDANGLAVGSTLTVHDGKQIPGNLVQPDASGTLQPLPIDVGTGSDQVFLILYGTGIRNHTQPVTATIGTTSAQVVFAAAQGTFVGEDQINVLIPQSLRGAGKVNLVLNVDGQTTNPVTIQIQ